MPSRFVLDLNKAADCNEAGTHVELTQLKDQLTDNTYDERLGEIYGSDPGEIAAARTRLGSLLDWHGKAFGEDANSTDVSLYTAPGRTEMGGNHTDHQQGAVLAGSVTLDMVACAAPNGTHTACVISEGYPEIVVNLDELDPKPEEEGTSQALVRGMAAAMAQRGYSPVGFNAVVYSAVPGGSGLSSSAAYEVLIGVILNHIACADDLTAAEIAQIGQFAENTFFGKPSGLMDQMGSALGGVAHLDFKDPAKPVIHPIPFDMEKTGYALCIIDSGADHADLTDDYTAIRTEMKSIAAFFGKDVLREVDPAEFWTRIPELRATTSDRAVLRAMHFFEDHARVAQQAAAIEEGRFGDFLQLVKESGISSQTQLQNLYSVGQPLEQAVVVTQSVAKHVLDGRGAVRVHGGGFAGTVQAYVPADFAGEFKKEVDQAIGPDACHILRIRPIGGAVIAG